MKILPIADAQVDLLAERLRAVGVGRREFLKLAAGLAAMGPAGFNAQPAAAAPKLAPGEKLAKVQTLRYGGGAWLQGDSTRLGFNEKEITDPSQVGVRAKDDWTLEVMLEGPRGYFPVLAAFLAALPAHRASVEKHADKWTEAANIVCNGPFVLETWQHGKVMVLR